MCVCVCVCVCVCPSYFPERYVASKKDTSDLCVTLARYLKSILLKNASFTSQTFFAFSASISSNNIVLKLR